MAGRILIVDDVATNRIVLRVKLANACYDPLMAVDAASARAAILADPPDVVLLDLGLPDGNGLDLLADLRRHPATRRLPVVVVTAQADADTRLAALRAGADDVLGKPVDDAYLMARLRAILRARQGDATPLLRGELAEPVAPFEHPGLIGLSPQRAEQGVRLRRSLAGLLEHRLTLLSREEALADFTANATALPDVYLIESLPDGGLGFLSELRSRAATRHAGIAVLCDRPATAAIALDLGADEVLSPDMAPAEIAHRLDRLIRQRREGESLRASVRDGLRQAMFDPLTGLHNRRYAMTQLAAIATNARTQGETFAVLLVDLDRFKSINDRFGHPAGDAVLVDIAARLAATMRAGDLLARIGGEEFLIALPATDLPAARAMAERLCHVVGQSPVHLPNLGPLGVTVSIGLTIAPDRPHLPDDITDIIARADHALLQAKTEGRNRVTVGLMAA